MAEQFFKLPRIGAGDEDDPRRAKYSDREGVGRASVNTVLSDESECVVLFEGEESILREIAKKDDVTQLTEAEVGRMRQAQNEASASQEDAGRSGPQPPAMGVGDSIEERLEDFVENAAGSSFVVMEGGGEFSKPMNLRRHPGFHQGNIGFLELSDLRQFPRYLIDTILRPESAFILPEHYNY